ncbi:hypothetical protein GM3708_3489 [Geminocystis sp. NIES-3708]|uniref:hypothetical protein n=1 Tax=Geminocystis sp. NIES-3708 TaxID=1615909 RepID=UPI0005FCCE3F|nr:hypothetical protein [Geminocystis sp. NIES-3708]BAQ63083.1 hypothetical protein GM3708_3489 [Geminocystis sp. NIES-3708]
MTQETNQTLTNPIYFVSPSGKIHAETCRHCQPQKEGWQRLESFTRGIDQGYQTCRLCCPSDVKKQVLSSNSVASLSQKLNPEENTSTVTASQNQPLEVLMIENSTDSETPDTETKITSVEKDSSNQDKTEANNQKTPKNKSIDKDKKEKNQLNSSDKQEKKTSKKSQPEIEKKRYKILAGNGCHQAIAEVQGILIPPSEPDQNFLLILPDGFQIEATFKTPRLHWIARNQETMLGSHWFRGYPKMKDNKLISLQIIAWDKGMPTNPRGFETWEFTGVWTAQKNITVQRSMMIEDVRQIAKETGFIKKFKYTFINSFDWVKNKKLWMGYVYKILCQRRGDTLEIKKVIPYACPRYKPDPKGFVKKDDAKNNYRKNDIKSKYNKGEKKEFKPN